MAEQVKLKRKKRFQRLHRPLNDEELKELEASIKADGCREPVICMQGDVIVDGDHRDQICRRLGIETPIRIKTFESDDEAELWILRNQLARRNLSENDFKLTLGRIYNNEKGSAGRPKKRVQSEPVSKAERTSEKIAKETGASESTVKRSGKYAEAFDSLPFSVQTAINQNPQSATEKTVLRMAKMDDDAKLQAAARQVRTGQEPTFDKALGLKATKPKSEPKPKKELTPQQDAAIKLNGTAKSIEKIRVNIDDIVHSVGKHAKTDTIQKLLDDALIGLKQWAKSLSS